MNSAAFGTGSRPSAANGSPIALLRSLSSNRHLIGRLAARELSAKWRGTALGMVWSLATPLLTFAVYAFVFTRIFQSRWPDGLSSTSYPLVLFSGLVLYGIFSESLNRAPTLVLEHASYVKKVVFPLEILACVAVLVAIVNALFGFVIVLAGMILVLDSVQWTCIALPVIALPYILLTLGATWFLASVGVFLRDSRQLITVLTGLLIFLTPIFYPRSSVPEAYRWIVDLNPLTVTFDEMRDALFLGLLPDPVAYGEALTIGLASAFLGFFWFMRTRSGFADVL